MDMEETITELQADVAALQGSVDGLSTGLNDQINNFDATVDGLFLLLSGYLVFFMQAGFASLESGSVRAKNTRNILLKNVMDAALGALIWWMIGFPFAYGESTPGANDVQGFIGRHQFFLADYTDNSDLDFNPYRRILEFGVTHAFWFFQWTFAATAATIVSGAVAERCRFVAYLFYTVFITGFIYPVVVHWVWSAEGYLSAFQNTMGGDHWENIGQGMIDFAGSGVVHMTGGAAALVAATLLGPRQGRFGSDGKPVDITPHSAALAGLGVLFLWFGWYGFNPGSTLALSGGAHFISAKVAVTTTLSAAAGGSTSLLISFLLTGEFNLFPALNGVLAGLVAICSGTATVEPWAAVLIGGLAAAVYTGASKLLIRLRIDDPLDAAPVHYFSGFFGLYATVFLSTRTNTEAAYGINDEGIFYGGDGEMFLANFAGSFLISAWVFTTSFLLFSMLKFTGLFRVPQQDEELGLDVSHHGGHAYEWMDHAPKEKTAEKMPEKPKTVEMTPTPPPDKEEEKEEDPKPTGDESSSPEE